MDVPRRAAALGLGLGLALAAALAWAALALRPEPSGDVAFFEPSVEEARRLTDPSVRDARPPDGAAGSGLVRWTVPAEAAARLFPLDGLGQVYDPWTTFRYPANLHERRWWPTGVGNWYVITNDEGLREDEDLRREGVDLRILVTGDSHTDGVCRNYQSFPNRLEQLLAEQRPGRTVDCLNAGKGGYSFYEYLGVLEKYADLRPDAFVVATYGGNDLYEVLTLRRYFQGEMPPRLGAEEYLDRLEAVKALDRDALAQGLLMVKYFQLLPGEAERALETAGQLLEAMRDRCAAQGTAFLLVYLPPWFDAQRERYPAPWDELFAALAIDEEDLALVDALGDRLLALAAGLGIETLDLRPTLREAEPDAYWADEWHLHPKGHVQVGRALAAWAAERLPVDG